MGHRDPPWGRLERLSPSSVLGAAALLPGLPRPIVWGYVLFLFAWLCSRGLLYTLQCLPAITQEPPFPPVTTSRLQGVHGESKTVKIGGWLGYKVPLAKFRCRSRFGRKLKNRLTIRTVFNGAVLFSPVPFLTVHMARLPMSLTLKVVVKVPVG